MSGGSVDTGVITVVGNDAVAFNGPLKILQTVTEESATANPLLVPSAPPTAGTIGLLIIGGSAAQLSEVRVNDLPRSLFLHSAHNGQGWVTYAMFLFESGDLNVRPVLTGGGNHVLVLANLSGMDQTPPFTASYVDDFVLATEHLTSAPLTSTSTGIAFAVTQTVVAVTDVGFSSWVPPSGWTQLAQVGNFGPLSTTIYVRGIGVDTYPADPLDPAVTTFYSFTSAVLGLYDLGLNIRPSVAISSNLGGQLLAPGTVEPPPSVHPAVPPVNPLPPEGDAIHVPLPPYDPRVGPYRGEE